MSKCSLHIWRFLNVKINSLPSFFLKCNFNAILIFLVGFNVKCEYSFMRCFDTDYCTLNGELIQNYHSSKRFHSISKAVFLNASFNYSLFIPHTHILCKQIKLTIFWTFHLLSWKIWYFPKAKTEYIIVTWPLLATSRALTCCKLVALLQNISITKLPSFIYWHLFIPMKK